MRCTIRLPIQSSRLLFFPMAASVPYADPRITASGLDCCTTKACMRMPMRGRDPALLPRKAYQITLDTLPTQVPRYQATVRRDPRHPSTAKEEAAYLPNSSSALARNQFGRTTTDNESPSSQAFLTPVLIGTLLYKLTRDIEALSTSADPKYKPLLLPRGQDQFLWWSRVPLRAIYHSTGRN